MKCDNIRYPETTGQFRMREIIWIIWFRAAPAFYKTWMGLETMSNCCYFTSPWMPITRTKGIQHEFNDRAPRLPGTILHLVWSNSLRVSQWKNGRRRVLHNKKCKLFGATDVGRLWSNGLSGIAMEPGQTAGVRGRKIGNKSRLNVCRFARLQWAREVELTVNFGLERRGPFMKDLYWVPGKIYSFTKKE